MRCTAVAALAFAAACAQPPPATPPATLQQALERAADLEGVPRPLLLAISYVESRWSMTGRSVDGGWGLMHLVDRADAPEAQSLARAAQLTGLAEPALRTEAFANARGGAALLRAEGEKLFARYRDLDESKLGDWYQAVMRISGVENARVADGFAAQVYRVLRDGAVADRDGELVRLVPQSFAINGAIWGAIEQDLSGEYCPNGACVAFVPASTSNYTAGRGGTPITIIVIHDMEGSYSGSIGWFQNPAAQASAHYDVRSSDGEITQQVHDGDTAWHAGNWDVNQHAIGIEHEGFAHTGAQWYTEAMYRSSAALVRWLTDTFHIPQDRNHIIGHNEVPNPNHAGWFGGAGAHHDPCDAWAGDPTWHNHVACYWDWNHYMSLVTGGGGGPATGVLSGLVGDACCGIAAGTRRPIAGATVVLEGTSYAATTDSNGTYSFTLPPGSYTPKASMNGYDPGDHTSLGGGYSATIAVTGGATAWGSILLRKSAPPPLPHTPVVTIVSPSNGASVASSPVEIAGTVDDKGIASVKISGKDAPAANGAFRAQVALVAGDNAITVTATNAAGTGSATVHVSYAPPQTGVQGKVTSGGAAVQGAGVSLSPGGARAVTDAEGHYLISSSPGAYTLAVDATRYQAASQAVTVPADRIATIDVALQPSPVPSTPHLRLDTPAEGQVFAAATATVSGVAEIADLKSLSVNGEAVTTSAGRFSVDVTLQPGANQIDVVAVRSDGQTVEAHVGVSYKPAAPAAASTGCASAGFAELLALLPLAAFLRRRT